MATAGGTTCGVQDGTEAGEDLRAFFGGIIAAVGTVANGLNNDDSMPAGRS